jgi:hypothetical protein
MTVPVSTGATMWIIEPPFGFHEPGGATEQRGRTTGEPPGLDPKVLIG